MRKLSRKWGLSVLAVALVLSIFVAGCSNSGGNSATQGSTNQGGTNQPANTKKEEPKKDPITLRVELFDRNNTPAGADPITNNWFTKYIQENFGNPNNITIEWVTVPRSEEVDKLNVLMGANQAPDISFTYNTQTVERYAKDGGLVDLGPYVDQFGPNLKKTLGDQVLNYGVFDDKQYAVVARRVIEAQVSTIIRQDWLDELGLPVPTTTEEFYNTLVAFKKAKPSAIPFGGQTDYFHTSPIYYSMWEWDKITPEDLYANPDWLQPGHKEAFRFLNKLYNEGLIDKDFPLGLGKDTNQFQKNFVNGQLGAATTNTNEPVYMSYLPELFKADPNAKITVIDPFTAPDGRTPKPAYTPNGIYLIVPKASEAKAEAAIKYLDWMAQPENIIALQNGQAGVHHDVVDGVPVPRNDDTANNLLYNYFDYCIILNGRFIDPDDNAKNIAVNVTGDFKDFTFDSIETGSKDGITRPRVLTTIESDIKHGTVLSKKQDEDMFVKIVTAKPDNFDAVYDSEVNDYMKVGGKEVMDEKRAAYQAENP